MSLTTLGTLLTISKLIISVYCFWKFLVGDKEKRATLWYGIATLIFVV